MKMEDILRNIIEQRKAGSCVGIASFCTANDLVIEACMQRAQIDEMPVLIEATANQVNQFGGYTGMLPADFRDYVYEIADGIGFPHEKIILGRPSWSPDLAK
jgi:D-tagatose-1,6-bisphosphate aldolase subunit GatZ/KbaZ